MTTMMRDTAGCSPSTNPPIQTRQRYALLCLHALFSFLLPRCAALQAASNLTMVSDGRPISPGPFLSAYVSGAVPDSSSRPVSPHFFDQPPTPGSFATGAEAQGGSAGWMLAG